MQPPCLIVIYFDPVQSSLKNKLPFTAMIAISFLAKRLESIGILDSTAINQELVANEF